MAPILLSSVFPVLTNVRRRVPEPHRASGGRRRSDKNSDRLRLPGGKGRHSETVIVISALKTIC